MNEHFMINFHNWSISAVCIVQILCEIGQGRSRCKQRATIRDVCGLWIGLYWHTMNINSSERDLKLTICNSPHYTTEDLYHQCDLYYCYMLKSNSQCDLYYYYMLKSNSHSLILVSRIILDHNYQNKDPPQQTISKACPNQIAKLQPWAIDSNFCEIA